MNYNKVILIGRVGGDPILLAEKFCSFSLATSEQYRDSDGETVTLTQWHRITCSGGTADFCVDRVKKGDLVFIEGKIKYHELEKENGTVKYTNIHAGRLILLASPRKSETESVPDDTEETASIKPAPIYKKSQIVGEKKKPIVPDFRQFIEDSIDDDVPF